MNRINKFKGMSDEKLEECFRQYIKLKTSDNIESELFLNVLNQYNKDIGKEKGMIIMDFDILHEIAFRWCKIYKNVF